jgi:Protein of unknown function (DUF3575)
MPMYTRALVVFATLLVSAPAIADPDNVVLADLGLHVIGVGEQRTVGAHTAVQLDLDYYSPWTELLADGRPQFAILGGVARARVFLYLDAALVGWWVSPFVQAGYAHGSGGNDGVVAAAGASIGYAWLFAQRWDLAIGIGAQYHLAHASPSFAGVWPTADLNIGYAF